MKLQSGLFTAAALLLGVSTVSEGVASAQQRPAYPAQTAVRPVVRTAAVVGPQRSPRNACRLACRKAYSKNVKGFGGQAAFRQRGICYANCRRTLPPTNAAPAQPGKR